MLGLQISISTQVIECTVNCADGFRTMVSTLIRVDQILVVGLLNPLEVLGKPPCFDATAQIFIIPTAPGRRKRAARFRGVGACPPRDRACESGVAVNRAEWLERGVSERNISRRVFRSFMAVTRMRFTGSGTGTYTIDLAKAISLQERKLHRQKKLYTVYGGFFVDTPSGTDVSRVNINTAPNTWVTRRAVNRGFRIWKKMVAKTLADSPGIKPGKYNDFKVYLNNTHGSAPLLPVSASGGSLYITGDAPEWDYSTLYTDDRAEDPATGRLLDPDYFELNIVGDNNPGAQTPGNPTGWTRVGLVQSWLDSRPHPDTQQPTDSVDGAADPLTNLFDSSDVNDDRITIVETEGDQVPYGELSMFGMAEAGNSGDVNLQRQSVVTTTRQVPTGPVHGFQALCGLVQLEVTSAEGTWELVLDVETVGENF